MTGTQGTLYFYGMAAGRITAWTMRPVVTGEKAGHVGAELTGVFAAYWVAAKPTEVEVSLTLPESGTMQRYRATVTTLSTTRITLAKLEAL